MKILVVLLINISFSIALLAQCAIENFEIYYCEGEEIIDLTQYEPNANGTYQYFASGVSIDNPEQYLISTSSMVNIEFTGDGINCPAVLASFDVELIQDDLPAVTLSYIDTLSCIVSDVFVAVTSIVGGNFEISWYFSGTLIGLGTVINIEQPGQYTVVVENLNTGCSVQQDFVVLQNIDFPDVAIDTTNNCDGTTTIDLTLSNVGPNYIVNWMGPDILEEYSATSILVGSPGAYNIEVLDLNTGCFSAITILVVEAPCTSVSNIAAQDSRELLVYPIPSLDGKIYMEWKEEINLVNFVSVNIYNTLGEHIYEKVFRNTANLKEGIDLSEYGQGNYWAVIAISQKQWVKQIVLFD